MREWEGGLINITAVHIMNNKIVVLVNFFERCNIAKSLLHFQIEDIMPDKSWLSLELLGTNLTCITGLRCMGDVEIVNSTLLMTRLRCHLFNQE